MPRGPQGQISVQNAQSTLKSHFFERLHVGVTQYGNSCQANASASCFLKKFLQERLAFFCCQSAPKNIFNEKTPGVLLVGNGHDVTSEQTRAATCGKSFGDGLGAANTLPFRFRLAPNPRQRLTFHDWSGQVEKNVGSLLIVIVRVVAVVSRTQNGGHVARGI